MCVSRIRSINNADTLKRIARITTSQIINNSFEQSLAINKLGIEAPENICQKVIKYIMKFTQFMLC